MVRILRSLPRQAQSSLHSRQAGQGGYRLQNAFGADGLRIHAQPQTEMSRSRSPRWSTPSLHQWWRQRVTTPTSLPNASFSRLESFGMNGELVVRMDKETGPIDAAKHVAAERKATTVIKRTPRKSSQPNGCVERSHQLIGSMVRTLKDVMENKAKPNSVQTNVPRHG